ncbi:GspH/FimT family pseudopilin [Alteromonas oceani]|uniref:Type II secretion system protein H n=1 Tax=Alteromonas oceani TaxID=2071609 RepID=A0ABV7K398_9ALTE|nr:GspH/FimT family pseudopilin [Alteromonas oceani]
MKMFSMRHSGYTLIELMITVAVLSIIAGVVVPGARGFINHSILTKEINELSALTRLARFKAMEEQTEVVVCPSQDYTNCISNWTYPSMAFYDVDGDGERDTNETLLSSTEKLHGSVKIDATSKALVFDVRGGANVTTTFTICDDTSKADKAVGLIINGYGKIAIAQDSDDDGVNENHAGAALSCS